MREWITVYGLVDLSQKKYTHIHTCMSVQNQFIVQTYSVGVEEKCLLSWASVQYVYTFLLAASGTVIKYVCPLSLSLSLPPSLSFPSLP